MKCVNISSPKGPLQAIEYCPARIDGNAPSFVLLLPGTSIRPGPGADKAHKYSFATEIPSIYRSIAQRLAREHDVPCLQICWRRFPADGGTTHDAVNDMLASVCFMKKRYGQQCAAILVGYSFGGAAILQFLAQCTDNSRAILNPMQGDLSKPRLLPWLHGCVSLSGALKGQGSDDVSLLSAMKYLELAQVPLLLVHGSEDDNVALSAAQKFYRKAAPPKSLCVLQGADHNLREAKWQDLVSEVISGWLIYTCVSRGSSGASRARAVQHAHHSAAASLCDLSLRQPIVTCAFEPLPQRLPSGGHLSFTACEVPSVQEVFAARAGQAPAEQVECRLARIAELTALHTQRQQKAREKQLRERRGSVREAYAKLQASRERRNRSIASIPSCALQSLAAMDTLSCDAA